MPVSWGNHIQCQGPLYLYSMVTAGMWSATMSLSFCTPYTFSLSHKQQSTIFTHTTRQKEKQVTVYQDFIIIFKALVNNFY